MLPLSSPLQSKRTRKKAAPLPPISPNISKVQLAGSIVLDSAMVSDNLVDSDLHSTSTHVGIQLQKSPKQKAPLPPLHHGQRTHQADNSNSRVFGEKGINNNALQFSSYSSFAGIRKGHQAVIGSTAQSELAVELDRMGNTEKKDVLVPSHSIAGHTVAAGSMILPDEMFRGTTGGIDQHLDLPLPSPPFEDCDTLYTGGDDLPPPPEDAVVELTYELGDDLPLPPELHESKCSPLDQEDDDNAQEICPVLGKQPKLRG